MEFLFAIIEIFGSFSFEGLSSRGRSSGTPESGYGPINSGYGPIN